MTTFQFYRFRFRFQALDAVHFPVGKSANTLRGAFGLLLRETAPPDDYVRWFEPEASVSRPAPSGLGDWPRPFVFRASHLDGQTISPTGMFWFDVHIFDVRSAALSLFRQVFEAVATSGLGAGRGRARLEGIEQVDLAGTPHCVTGDPAAPSIVSLDPDAQPAGQVCVRFVTPTELKARGRVAERPEFPILFARLRDRVSTLRALYGAGPLDIDFRGMADRANTVSLTRCELSWERVERQSARTGQTHSIGGFTGEVEYRGQLAEFLPWLRAARWVGVGRQTVWGKGDVRVVECAQALL